MTGAQRQVPQAAADSPAPTRRWLALAWPVVFLVAVAVAICAALVSRDIWRPGGTPVPWGLALAVVGSVGLVVFARGISPRLALPAAGGWLVGFGLALVVNRGGDFVIAEDGLGWGFTLLGGGSVVVAGAWRGPRR